MNKDRRSAIIDAAKQIADCADLIRIQRDLIEQTKDEEREAFDAMPEGLQNADRGQEMEAAISQLEEAVDALDCMDYAAVGNMLSEAIDRDVANMPEATLDEATMLANRFARLPGWAKDEIERLKRDLASVKEQAQEIYPSPEDGDDNFIIADYLSPHKGKALPFERITLRGITITIEDGYEGVNLSTNNGQMVVRPQVSNSIFVKAECRW